MLANLAKLARGMVLFVLVTLTVVYLFSGQKRPSAPPVPPDTILGYMNA